MEKTTPSDSGVEALKDFLLVTVQRHHEQTNEGLLLANLGWAVINQRPELRVAFGRSRIGEFVARELSQFIELRTDPNNASVKVAYPRTLVAAPAPSQAAVAPPTAPAQAPVQARKYEKAVVLAFTRPIPEGHQRFLLLLDASIFYRDLLQGTEAPAGGFEVEPGLIAPASTDAALDGRVDAWLAKHGLPLARVLERPKGVPAKSARHGSLLDRLLDSLSDAERKRVQLPLDIVAKLQNTPK